MHFPPTSYTSKREEFFGRECEADAGRLCQDAAGARHGEDERGDDSAGGETAADGE